MTSTTHRAVLYAAAMPVALVASTLSTLAVVSDGNHGPADTGQPGYFAGMATTDAGKYKNPINILSEVVKYDPSNAEAWNMLGYSSRKPKRCETPPNAMNSNCDLLGALPAVRQS